MKRFAFAAPKLGLLIDIQAKMDEGKGGGYARWAKTYKLKQMAEAVCFIKEQGIASCEELAGRADAAVARFNGLSDSIKASETRLAEIAALEKHIINYSKTREVYTEYRKSGFSKKFLEAHREEITLHKAAKKVFDELGVGTTSYGKIGRSKAKIPTMKQLKQEYVDVLSEKKKDYSECRAAAGFLFLILAYSNIDLE